MIGAWLAECASTARSRWFSAIFGIADFHTHLRLRWMRTFRWEDGTHLCELGCGSGIALIEALRQNTTITATGFETDIKAVEQAQEFSRCLQLSGRVQFKVRDLASGLPSELANTDYVLLLDVLEHLTEPRTIANEIERRIKRGARLLVSVPTPLYPRIFGRRYHMHIGHLHDGFTLEQLDRLFAGLTRRRVAYSTGPLSWPGILLSYRLAFVPGATASRLRRVLARTAVLLSVPFRCVDWWNGSRASCSIFVEYTKDR